MVFFLVCPVAILSSLRCGEEKRREEQNRTEQRRGEIFGVALVSMYRHLEIAAGPVSCFGDSRKPRKMLSFCPLCCYAV
jgi:hypothetical protein